VLAVSIVWLVLAATPYTVPRPHHGVDAEIYVVYLEKRGFRFRETSIAAWRDGKAYVTQEVRKALRYRSQGITHRVVLSRETLRHVFDLVRSPEFKALQTERRK
jgi:hypothetical protein